MNLRAVSSLAALAVLLAACSPLTALNWTVPSVPHDRTELAYGPDPRQRLDVYRPKDLTAAAPMVVFFYGGGWEAGDKTDYRFAALALMKHGFVVAVADYRVYPQVRFPAFLEDSARAVAFVHARAASLGGDPARLFLMGHSAGAYNAVMLGLDRRYLDAAGLLPETLRGIVGISGPYDFLPFTSEILRTIFAGLPEVTQPITFARADAPPMLLVTGTDDDTVLPKNTRNLVARLRVLGASVETAEYPGIGHAGTAMALTPLFRGRAPVLDDALRFLASHL
jgi:acetyl esterase/lipase